MSPTIQAVLDKQVIPVMEEREQCSRNCSHSARGHKSVVRTFDRGQFLVEHLRVWRVVQANILDIMVTRFATGLEHGRLENRHTHSSLDPRLRFTGMDELCLNTLELFLFQSKILQLDQHWESGQRWLRPLRPRRAARRKNEPTIGLISAEPFAFTRILFAGRLFRRLCQTRSWRRLRKARSGRTWPA